MKRRFKNNLVSNLMFGVLNLTNLRYNLFSNINKGEPLTYEFFRENMREFKKIVDRNPERGFVFFENCPKYQLPKDEEALALIQDRSYYSPYLVYMALYYEKHVLLRGLVDHLCLEYVLKMLNLLYSGYVRDELRKNVEEQALQYVRHHQNGVGGNGVLSRAREKFITSDGLLRKLEELNSQTIRTDENVKDQITNKKNTNS